MAALVVQEAGFELLSWADGPAVFGRVADERLYLPPAPRTSEPTAR